ncbi:uncharacterized protein Z519_03685 [Cladophialophora bantiana CBS 173.52]|uniref:Uncharacterized protein n=1 Tax=Cladophialophora bantiana (strain ATCC 10958 / CBS 173.52 / CDC B-1940 / NIH 8579) TaxID=1442370 RepID=A0A0D2EYR0_CLAB1|nr:uncharacterized protein Z519_03685 [Cladophialophora bantiana CBS 173.52]KIW95101.1 hypothetical protein Z519_03685 [Cladophialophora bantiana CBS 173.52]
MDSPQVLDPSDDALVQLPQSQGGDTGDPREDASHGVVGMVPGSDGKTRPRRPRGRHAKDPLAKSIAIKCQRLEDLEAQLQEHLADPATDREHTTLEFDFPVTAAFMVAAREPLGKGDLGEKRTPYTYSLFNKTAITVIDALHTIEDPKERVIMQKGISKTLVEACQNVDGYRYSFHNHWISREDQASRFSYYCNDSVLNKGRAANEGVSKIKAGVKVRKPVYDCHGLISIKFSVTKNKLELHYKHIPLHKTFEERAPNPRNGSKRKRLLEIFHPERLPKQKRRKSDEPKPPRSKRSAAEPVPKAGEGSTAPQRENSLAPLFDFLGRLEEDKSGPDTTEPPTTDVDVDVVKDRGPDSGSRRKKKTVPGTFIWNIADSQKQKRAPKRSQTALVVTAALAPPPATAAPADMIPPSDGPTVTSVSSTELELRARLEQAEQKIRDLEAEKQQQARVPAERPSALLKEPQGPRPPPLATAYPALPPNTYFPPPHFPYPSASLQWSYAPHPYHYPYPYPPGWSSSLPFPNPSPGTAPGATHPDAYHYQSQPLPPLGQQRPRSNPSPTYGFVPSPIDPMDPVRMRIRSYIGPSQPHAIPDSSSVSRVEPRAETQATAQSTRSPSQRQTERSSRAPSEPAPEPSDRNATAPEPSDGKASVVALAELAEPEAREATPVPTSTTPVSRAAVPDPNSTELSAGTEQDSSTVAALSAP